MRFCGILPPHNRVIRKKPPGYRLIARIQAAIRHVCPYALAFTSLARHSAANESNTLMRRTSISRSKYSFKSS